MRVVSIVHGWVVYNNGHFTWGIVASRILAAHRSIDGEMVSIYTEEKQP